MTKRQASSVNKEKKSIKYSDSFFSDIIFRNTINDRIEVISGKLDKEFCYSYLLRFDKEFFIPLSNRVDLKKYATKISKLANTFLITVEGNVAGLICSYFYDKKMNEGFVTLVHIIDNYRGNNLASYLHQELISYSISLRFTAIKLIVSKENNPAYRFYTKLGYRDLTGKGERREMKLLLDKKLYNSILK